SARPEHNGDGAKHHEIQLPAHHPFAKQFRPGAQKNAERGRIAGGGSHGEPTHGVLQVRSSSGDAPGGPAWSCAYQSMPLVRWMSTARTANRPAVPKSNE